MNYTITIESGVPIPQRPGGSVSRYGYPSLRELEVGDSFAKHPEQLDARFRSGMHRQARACGIRVTVRRMPESGEMRVWRIPRPDAQGSENRSAQLRQSKPITAHSAPQEPISE